jgi:glycosyltransferase involved in cell wall biosynthesis
MPRISVIIPTHSRPHLLPRAIASAQEAGTDLEIIVVDDASADETAEVCKNLGGIKYVRLERNQGVAGARNVGVLESSGQYIAFLDDDDLRLPGSLDLQATALDDHPEAGFICGAMIMADQNYRRTGEVVTPRSAGGDVFWELLELDFPIMGLSALIRRDCFLRVGLFKRKLDGIDDWDMFVRIAELYPVLVHKQAVGLYREPTARSAQGSSARAAQLRRVSKHQLTLFELPRAAALSWTQRRALRQRMNSRIADTLLWKATRLLPQGEFGPACANVTVALRLAPLRALQPSAYRKLITRLWRRQTEAVGPERETIRLTGRL